MSKQACGRTVYVFSLEGDELAYVELASWRGTKYGIVSASPSVSVERALRVLFPTADRFVWAPSFEEFVRAARLCGRPPRDWIVEVSERRVCV